MQDFTIGGQRNGAGAVHGLLDLVAPDFSRTRAHADASVSVDPSHVRSTDTDDGLLDGCARDIFGGFDRLLNRRHGLVELHDDPLSRATRFRDTVPAIAQAVVGRLRHQRAGLGAAYVNRGKKVALLVPHRLWIPRTQFL